MTHTQRSRRRRHGRPFSKGLLAGMVVMIVIALAGLSLVGYIVSVAASAPPLDELKPRDLGGTSSVYAADGSRLGFIQANELRQRIPGNRIPKVMKDATIAIEDERYYKHKGVDYPGVVRAAVKNVFSRGKTIQGGSTITMQLVRSLYISNERTIERKIREAKLAEELENERSKEWILDEYLNSVPFGTVGGQTAIGVQAAARMYFGKPAWKLKLHEAALLAGIPQATDSYSPVRHPEASVRRRNEVLRKMLDLGMITPAEAQEAMARDVDLKLSKYFTARREEYFFDYVKDVLIREYGARRVKRGGLRVDTTIEVKKQQAARAAIAGRLAGVGPSSAIVTIDHRNGEILAMASSADYKRSKFNLAAQGHRQPGSTFKIMALMAAVRKGVNPAATSYVSKPLKFEDPEWGPIEVKTYDGSYRGSMSLTGATLASDNTVYMQLALDVGPEDVKRAAQDMGITTKLDGYPAESLGGLTIGVSPLEMAVAYATIANGGYRLRPTAIRKVTFPDGTSERPDAFKPKRTKVFEDWVTWEVTKILEQNMTSGTGTAAQVGCPAAGKTGTTDNNTDAWFVGFTPRLSTAVWVGYPERQVFMSTEYYGGQVAGGTFPAEIWGDYMEVAKGKRCDDFTPAKTTPRFVPFDGRYANGASTGTGGSGETYYPPSTTTDPAPAPAPTTAPPPADDGFDPGSYESPPQEDPGNGNGNGGGNGNGQGGGAVAPG
jgi:penicillin-binding protein 1A